MQPPQINPHSKSPHLLALPLKIADNANEFLIMTSTFSLFQYFLFNFETNQDIIFNGENIMVMFYIGL